MECVLRGEGHGLDQMKLELSELHLFPYLAGCRDVTTFSAPSQNQILSNDAGNIPIKELLH